MKQGVFISYSDHDQGTQEGFLKPEIERLIEEFAIETTPATRQEAILDRLLELDPTKERYSPLLARVSHRVQDDTIFGHYKTFLPVLGKPRARFWLCKRANQAWLALGGYEVVQHIH